ncbi:hypothetical protein JIG36_25290 [Actinoplanes sp. LDG1-06]|uniref:Gram-positive cocci surface proteins LPxTG domain-containing protein n=1 Tax=Paractinoplanes ovalisporus TaxID=2810368 RepID=A0ABS2AHP5_9ACTN|nr:hypothetical protein [Actinoplanes ovalisporus]MBM2618878.1 hypothetical protein [Actinoplanes ovalisporus]
MRPLVLRRLLAALAALALVLAWAVPAQAAAPAEVDFYVRNHTIVPGSSAYVQTMLFADRPLPVAKGAVSLRYRFIDQDPAFTLAQESSRDNCRVAPGDVELICTSPVTALIPAGVDAVLVGYVKIADDGVIGRQATLTATMTVEGHAPITRTARITIGEGVTLTAPGGDRMVSAEPGDPIDAPLTVTNSGTLAAQGVGFISGNSYFLESRTQYSNCEYTDGALNGCTFDQTLEPGTTYRLNLPFRVRADTLAPDVQAGGWLWMTDAELADQRQWIRNGGYGQIGTPGRGGVLRLVPVATAKAGPPQAQRGHAEESLKVQLTGRNSADVAAVGATASGRKGAVVTVPVSLVNHGPAAFDHTRGAGWPDARFYVPKGATAVRVPDSCFPMTAGGTIDGLRPGAPGSSRYSCDFSTVLKVGGTVKWEFGLRIDEVIAGARGAVAVGAPTWTGELNPANNTAAVVLNPAAAPPPSGGSGGGGGLPITGPQGALFAGIGLLLVLGGAGALFLTRRRAA